MEKFRPTSSVVLSWHHYLQNMLNWTSFVYLCAESKLLARFTSHTAGWHLGKVYSLSIYSKHRDRQTNKNNFFVMFAFNNCEWQDDVLKSGMFNQQCLLLAVILQSTTVVDWDNSQLSLSGANSWCWWLHACKVFRVQSPLTTKRQ